MTPKEKAFNIVDIFQSIFESPLTRGLRIQEAKQCASIEVDEIIQLRKGYFDCTNPMQDESYWQEVKQEIELL